MTATDAYKDYAGHSVLGANPVVLSARKRVPDPEDDPASPAKKAKKTASAKSKSKTVIEAVKEDTEEDEPDERIRKNKKADGDVFSTKRKILQTKRKDVYSFEADSDDDGPVSKKAVTASSKKSKVKKSSTKQAKDSDSDASTVSKKNRSSKTEKAPKKKTSTKSVKKKATSSEPKENGDKEGQKEKDDEKEEEEELKPPPSPKVKPKPLRKVSKPKDRTSSPLNLPSTSSTKPSTSSTKPSTSSSKPSSTKSSTKITLPTASAKKQPLTVFAEGSPSTGRTKLPLSSPSRRKEPLELDLDLTQPSRKEPTLQERLRDTISKVASSTPILSQIPRPSLRNTMSPVTNGVALVMSDDETMEPGNKSNKVQEKSSNIDELLMEVEKKSIDADSDDDVGPIMPPNRGYSRRMSATSSEHSSIARRSDVRFNNILRNKPESPKVLSTKSVQADTVADDEDRLYKKLSKLFEALCTQHGVEGTINVQGIGRIEMKLTKGRDSLGSPVGKGNDHCLSQVISLTKEKDVQTEDVEFKEHIDGKDFEGQTEITSASVEVQVSVPTSSNGIQTDYVIVSTPPLVVDLSSAASTQTETQDHVSVGREVGNARVDSAVGSQNVVKPLNNHVSSHQGGNSKSCNISTNTTAEDEELGSDFSQSIIDMLEEENRLKDENCRKEKNEDGEVISIAETPPSELKRLSAGNNTTLALDQTTMNSTRRSLVSSFDDVETILESDPED